MQEANDWTCIELFAWERKQGNAENSADNRNNEIKNCAEMTNRD